uniref:uroporphyrinogen-III C-methyltransferase n=1 Tax=Eutreptiella gymnastica TaxID=73025 RepID=A0A7S4LJB9_9EUGL
MDSKVVVALGVGLGLSLFFYRRKHTQSPRSKNDGIVWLIGAGPGDVDLLTVKGMNLVRQADVIVADELVDRSISDLAPAGCKFIEMGKRGGKADSVPQEDINTVLVAECKKGHRVARLKGGDPLVFGRVWPEIEALNAAGCQYDVIPGVTSALSAPAAVGIPITHKELSRHFVVVSCHKPDELDFADLSKIDTIVILMGTRTLPIITSRLQEAGLTPSLPVAIIQWAGRPEQRVFVGTLDTIVKQTQGETLSPAIVVIGKVAALAKV